MKQDTELEKLARQELDRSVQDLDDNILTRLKSARQKAVEVAANSESKSAKWHLPELGLQGWWLLPAGGIAATVFVITFSVSILTVETSGLDSLSVEDLAVLSGGEDIELFEELEFYQWLEDEKHSNS